MKTVFRLTFLSVLLGLAITAFPRQAHAGTTPDVMHISCTAPNPDHQTGLHRPKGDGNIWTFSIVLDGDARFVDGPHWSYPGKDGNDPDWGLITGGADGDSSLNWSSPGETGDFQVRVNGQIVCGDGGDGAPIDFSAGWDGKVEFNAEIKVKRSGTPEEDYSGSATVAAGGKSTSEHQADVEVIATDDEGNPMSDISVDAPTIQDEDDYMDTKANISPSSATTDSEGKAHFTFTSSDIVRTVTLEVDGGESSASASIEQDWTQLPNTEGDNESDSWQYSGYIDYDTPFTILFRMALDQNGNIPITSHDVRFSAEKVGGLKWNPSGGFDWDGDGEPDGEYESVPPQDYSVISTEYGDLASFDSTTKSGGHYTTQLTINSNSEFLVDSIQFDATDWNAYDNQ